MKIRITILIAFTLLLSWATQSQTVEEFDSFNSSGDWTTNNGAGVQNYGGSENYATFNIGASGYPNSTDILITSPVTDFTDCNGLVVSFPIKGEVEANYDIMYFQYKDGGSWITDTSFTGLVDMTYTSGTLPTSLTQFRFKLSTDGSVNSYWTQVYHWFWGWQNDTEYVYYYDMANFSTFCASTLPVELISFSGFEYMNRAVLQWQTATEINNEKFELRHCMDAISWNTVSTHIGFGNTNEMQEYNAVHNMHQGVNYYQLKQIDYDGASELSDIISITFDGYKITDNVRQKYNSIGQLKNNR